MNELTANMKTEEAIKEKIRESRFESINGKDLMEMDLPPLHYTISTILPHGFFILAGGAKVGKSWLAEQISYAVASGGQIWGYQAIQSEVLYLGLEDTVTRLQSRFEMLEAYEGNHERLFDMMRAWLPTDNHIIFSQNPYSFEHLKENSSANYCRLCWQYGRHPYLQCAFAKLFHNIVQEFPHISMTS